MGCIDHWDEGMGESVVKSIDFGMRHTVVQVPDPLFNSNGTLVKLLNLFK